MIKLYYSPGTACLAPHFLLEELGLAYELVLVDTSKQEHQQAAYLQLNPNGKIPLLIDGDFALTESAAICLYLMDQYAVTSTSPLLQASVGSFERAHLYQWMLYLSNTLQAELLTYFYPERLHDDPEVVAQIKEKRWRLPSRYTLINCRLFLIHAVSLDAWHASSCTSLPEAWTLFSRTNRKPSYS